MTAIEHINKELLQNSYPFIANKLWQIQQSLDQHDEDLKKRLHEGLAAHRALDRITKIMET